MQTKLLLSLVFLAALVVAAGCTSGTYYVDRDFGKVSRASFEQQIINPDPTIHAATTPEGQRGIISEEVMDVHTQTFGERPRSVNIFQFGVED